MNGYIFQNQEVRYNRSHRTCHRRWHGYKSYLSAHHIPYDPILVLQTRYSLVNGREGANSLLDRDDPLTAIFCSNDYLAIGAMEGGKDLGLPVPGDLSIVSWREQRRSS